jgi:hypothetical protein
LSDSEHHRDCVRAKIERRSGVKFERRLTVNLAPGMAVTVEIKTGTRRLIEYLMSPLLRYRHESLRER